MSVRFYLRHPETSVVSRGDRCVFMRPGRPQLVLAPRDAASVSRALQALTNPSALADLEPLVDLRDLLLLVAEGFVLQAGDPEALLAQRGSPSSPRRCKRITLAVSGAVGAVNAPALAMVLDRHFAERVDVVLTDAATKLVAPDAFGYLGIEPWTSAFARRGEVNVPHVFLASADLVIVAPASAHTIHKLATGACSDLVSLTVAATRSPVVVAPSMNVAMWDNAAVAHNVSLLRARGLHIVEPAVGLEVGERAARADAAWSFGGANLDPALWLLVLNTVLEGA
jgi:hypothetical protein